MKGISVIIPTYNRQQLLKRALQSVADQSRSCDEILVVDDGSTDLTESMVEKFATDMQLEVRYFYQENNGPAAARNCGIRNAQYDYLAFLDSDDHWFRRKLELQYAALEENPESMISHTKEKWLRRGEHLNQKKKHQPGNGDIFRHCLQLCAVGMSTVMAKKNLFESVGMFNETLRCCEDYDLWIRVSSVHQFLLVDEPLTIKEGGRPDQVSFEYRVGMDKLRIAAINNLLRIGGLTPEQKNETYLELQRKCSVYGNGCFKHNKTEEGKRYLDMAQCAEQQVLA